MITPLAPISLLYFADHCTGNGFRRLAFIKQHKIIDFTVSAASGCLLMEIIEQ